MTEKAQQLAERIIEHKDRGMFTYCGYELSRNEAETVLTALAEYIKNHEKEGNA